MKLLADLALGFAYWGKTAPPDGSPEAKVISCVDAVLNLIVQIAVVPVGLSGDSSTILYTGATGLALRRGLR